MSKKEEMPDCKLCKSQPMLYRDEPDGFEGACCMSTPCPLFSVEMSREEWVKLHCTTPSTGK